MSAGAADPALVSQTIYSAGRVRIPVKKGVDIDILKTYDDLIEVRGKDKFACLICVRRSAFSGVKAAELSWYVLFPRSPNTR